MADKQPGSQYWGTGSELESTRKNSDREKMERFITKLGKKLYGTTFIYTSMEFRGLHLPVTIIVKGTKNKPGPTLRITPFAHLMSEDGYGHNV